MLYALAAPASFAVLVLSFLAAATVHGVAQLTTAAARPRRLHRPGERLSLDPRRHLDPFGAVAAAISGLGWARQAEDQRGRRHIAAIALSGVLANLLVGVTALGIAASVPGGLPGSSLGDLQSGVPHAASAVGIAYLFGLSNVGMAALSLVPVPPLPGGRVLFALGPRSVGWQKARFWLIEQNIGTVVLLALLLVPLGGPQPVLPALLDVVVAPLLRPFAGG